jgi:rubrerythrin
MNFIDSNPFRILGIPITATEREVAKQINKLATYAEIGKSKSLDTDFSFLPVVERTPDVIEEAKNQIEQSENKLLYSFFWFWENNSADELAFEILKEGNIEKAISIWEKSIFSNKNKIYKSIVLFENLIATSSHFDNTDDESHLLKKDGEEYLVERKKEDSYSIPTAFCDLNFEDNWIIECDTTWIGGVDNTSYGIVFGREKGSYYFFGIAGSGSYMYGKYNDWTFNSCIDWKENDNYNKWSSNKLRIEKIDNTLKFFINGEHVNSWESEPFFGKNFGFKVSKKQKISFRNFKFSKLVEHEIYGEGIVVSAKNFSNIKNLSTLYLAISITSTTFNLNHFKNGIALAKNIFDNANMVDYSRLIASEKYNYNSEKALHFYLNGIIESIKPFLDKPGGISTSELVSSFATFPIEAKQFLNSRFIAKQIQNIDREIETSELSRKESAETATEAGKLLVKNIKEDIDYLEKTLGKGDYQFQTIADKLSLAIVKCGIDSFNFCKTASGEIDYPKAIKSEEGYLNEYEYAFSIAFTQRVKDKAKENLDSCKQYIKDKEYYTCWFCNINDSEEESKFEKKIYNITSRDFQGVKYQYVGIKIPRCPKCKKFHRLDYHFESTADGADGIIYLIAIVMEFIFFYIGGNLISFIAKGIYKLFDKDKQVIKNTSNST